MGPGPWQIVRPSKLARGYQPTPDGDPRHLYDNVRVALDASRHLHNGEPAALARWLDSLELAPGDRFLHVGCGAGYYTAVAAEVVGRGRVVGVELDPVLAERARENLRPWRNVTLVAGDGSELAQGSFDAILVNAGATEPIPRWLEQLRPGGRLLETRRGVPCGARADALGECARASAGSRGECPHARRLAARELVKPAMPNQHASAVGADAGLTRPLRIIGSYGRQ